MTIDGGEEESEEDRSKAASASMSIDPQTIDPQLLTHAIGSGAFWKLRKTGANEVR